jgi:hypothetical protein
MHRLSVVAQAAPRFSKAAVLLSNTRYTQLAQQVTSSLSAVPCHKHCPSICSNQPLNHGALLSAKLLSKLAQYCE